MVPLSSSLPLLHVSCFSRDPPRTQPRWSVTTIIQIQHFQRQPMFLKIGIQTSTPYDIGMVLHVGHPGRLIQTGLQRCHFPILSLLVQFQILGTSSSENQPVSRQLGNVHAISALRPITPSVEAQHTVEKQTDDTLGVNTTVLEKPLTGIRNLFKDVERGPTGAPLTYPYYRFCPTTGSLIPNFHFRNGAHYLPISCIKKALEQNNKPPEHFNLPPNED